MQAQFWGKIRVRRESERAEERLCEVNGRILGSRELVSGAGQSLREMRETYCVKICDIEEAGKILYENKESGFGLHTTTT